MFGLLLLQVAFCSLCCLAKKDYAWPPTWLMNSSDDPPPFQHNPPLQSPIEIRVGNSIHKCLPQLVSVINHNPKNVISVRNDGESASLEITDESVKFPQIYGGPLKTVRQFALGNVHFHWGRSDWEGSEHTINGHRFAMEAHIIHYNLKYNTFQEALNRSDGLTVVAILMKAGRHNPEFERLVKVLPSIREAGKSVDLNPYDALSWVPIFTPRGYFTYPGSLTTSPFSENVIWFVYPKPIDVSSRQVQQFRELLTSGGQPNLEHSREVQPFNGRTLKFSVCH